MPCTTVVIRSLATALFVSNLPVNCLYYKSVPSSTHRIPVKFPSGVVHQTNICGRCGASPTSLVVLQPALATANFFFLATTIHHIAAAHLRHLRQELS